MYSPHKTIENSNVSTGYNSISSQHLYAGANGDIQRSTSALDGVALSEELLRLLNEERFQPPQHRNSRGKSCADHAIKSSNACNIMVDVDSRGTAEIAQRHASDETTMREQENSSGGDPAETGASSDASSELNMAWRLREEQLDDDLAACRAGTTSTWRDRSGDVLACLQFVPTTFDAGGTSQDDASATGSNRYERSSEADDEMVPVSATEPAVDDSDIEPESSNLSQGYGEIDPKDLPDEYEQYGAQEFWFRPNAEAAKASMFGCGNSLPGALFAFWEGNAAESESLGTIAKAEASSRSVSENMKASGNDYHNDSASSRSSFSRVGSIVAALDSRSGAATASTVVPAQVPSLQPASTLSAMSSAEPALKPSSLSHSVAAFMLGDDNGGTSNQLDFLQSLELVPQLKIGMRQ